MTNHEPVAEPDRDETRARKQLFAACDRARVALTRYPAVGETASPIAVASATEQLEMLLEALEEAQQHSEALRALANVSREGLLIAGTTDFAIEVLRMACAELSAKIDSHA